VISSYARGYTLEKGSLHIDIARNITAVRSLSFSDDLFNAKERKIIQKAQ